MMSMAGGWFFLTVNEAFTLGDRDFRLPGVGSYMAVAIKKGDRRAMAWAIVAMIVMIVAVDQLLWRPLVAWSSGSKRVEERTAGVVGARPRRQLAVPAPGAPETEGNAAARSGSRGARGSRPGPDGRAPSRDLVAGLGSRRSPAAHVGGWKLVGLLARFPRPSGSCSPAPSARPTSGPSALALGAAWTVPVGILIGRSAEWSQRLQPFVQIVASFPAPMVFPLVTGASSCSAFLSARSRLLMLLGSQWYVLFNVLAGAMAIPHDLKDAAQVWA